MTGTNRPFHPIKRAFATTFVFVSFISYPMPVLAQPNQLARTSSESVHIHFSEKEEDGSSRGRPGRRDDTGSRGDCPSVEVPLTALMPASNLGLALEEHPTFWFYVPYKSDQASSGEFSLQDEANNDVYRTSFTLPGKPGVVSLRLTSAAPLEINKTYQWYFKLYCDREKSSTPVFVRGWVQRIALGPDLEHRLKATTTARDRIALYAQNGIWHTAMTELAKLRLAEPQNITLVNDWANLLKDIGLENLALESLVGSVTANFQPARRQPRNEESRLWSRELVERDEALRL